MDGRPAAKKAPGFAITAAAHTIAARTLTCDRAVKISIDGC